MIVDRFTKMSFFLPVNSLINASELATIFYREIECKYGPPQGIVTDRGTTFTSQFWRSLCEQSGTRNRFTTAYHPQGDGQTERANQTLEQYLRAFTHQNVWNWPNLLPTAFFACNSARSETIGKTPFMALYGYEPSFWIPSEHWHSEDKVPRREVPAVGERLEKLKAIRKECEENWKHAVEIQARYYNERHKAMEFKIGGWVSLSTRHLALKHRKLAPRRIGPFRVIGRRGKQSYHLALPEKYARIHDVFHVSQLEPWKVRDKEDLTSGIGDLPDLEEEDANWELEELRDHQDLEGMTYYLVKWKGWPSEYNSWVSEEDMNADEAIEAYKKGRRKKHDRQRRDDEGAERPRKRQRRR
jgi:transposase InsO family protein